MLTQALRGKEFYSRQASVSSRQSLKERQLAETRRLQRRRYAQSLVETLIEHFGLGRGRPVARALLGLARHADPEHHWKLQSTLSKDSKIKTLTFKRIKAQ
jgi:hypothetical protein